MPTENAISTTGPVPPFPQPPSHVVSMEESSISSDDYTNQKEARLSDGKTPQLLDDPDDKKKFGYSQTSSVVKVTRFMLSINNHPWIPLIAVILWSAAAVGIATAASRAYPQAKREKCRYLCSPVAFDNTVAAYVGLALFLLLGFRVNEAYGRYERGLEIWQELIQTTMTSFATHAGRVFPPGLWHAGDRRRLFAWLVAFPVCLKRKLRGERTVPELEGVLSAADIECLVAAPSMPAYCLVVLNTYIHAASRRQEEFPQVFIDRMIKYSGKLSLAMNKCGNIAQYSINYGYLAHLRLFMGIWVFMLPFSLVQDLGWYTVVVVPLVAYGILGMEKIAEELTQPFGYDFNDIPIGLMCNQMTEKVWFLYNVANSPVNSFVHDSSQQKVEYAE